MKQIFVIILIVLLFFLMLFFPVETFDGSLSGLLLWFQTVLPTLLPFSIVSNILITTNGALWISRIFAPVISFIFGVSQTSCYAILVGFLCGYPMGAKTVSDLVVQNKLSREEGQYLLSFCNNTSPMFIISYIVNRTLNDSSFLVPTLVILTISPVLCSFYFRRKYHVTPLVPPKNEEPFVCFNFDMIDYAIMNGFETLTKVGGYIILFSILFQLGTRLNLQYLLPFLEITNGIPYITNTTLPEEFKYIYILAITSYGGLCSIFQTNSMIKKAGLSIRNYQKEKLITAMVTSLLAYVYILFIRS